MSKPRKLAIAGLILAGGYFAALILGGEPIRGIAPSGVETPRFSGDSWFAGLGGWFSAPRPVASDGELVPDVPRAVNVFAADGTFAERRSQQPTWLSAARESDSISAQPESPLATHSTHPTLQPSTPPPLSDEHPPLAAEPISATRPSAASDSRTSTSTGLKARILEVRPAAAVASRSAASTWDRWPRSPSADAAVESQAVPATFQDLSALPLRPVQAALDDSEIVRKNSPPRDPGAAPIESLRTHIVIDGDTLVRLADRYLDDPERSTEIYRLNRDVLTNPELLPIGVELRIPPRQRPGDALAALNPAPGLAATSSHSDTMVPVTSSPTPLREPPQAKLLQPIAQSFEH